MDSDRYLDSKKDHDYALTVLYRDNLVSEREERIKKRLEQCKTENDQAGIQAIEQLLANLDQKKYEYKLKSALEEAERLVKVVNKDCQNHYPRFCERIEPCIKSLRQKFQDETKLVQKDEKIQAFQAQFEASAKEWLQKAQDYEIEDKLQRAMYEPKSALSSALEYLKRYAIYNDTDRLNEKIKTEINNVKSNPLFFGLKSFENQLNEFYIKYDAYQDLLNTAYLEKEIKEKYDKVAFYIDIINFPHYLDNRTAADLAEKISEAQGGFDDFKNNSPQHYKSNQKYQDFVQKYTIKCADIQKKFEALQLKLYQRNCEDRVNDPLNLVNAYFQGYRFDQALEELDNARSALQDLQEDKKLNFIKEVNEFLGKNIKKISEFENKINEKLLADQFRNESQSVWDKISQCDIYIQRQEFDNVAIYLDESRSKFFDLSNNKKYLGRKDFEEFYAKYKKTETEIEEKFAKTLVNHDFQADTQSALGDLTTGDAMLQFHKEDQALEYIDRATEQRFDIEYNRKFKTIEKRVKEFVTSFDEKAKVLREKVEAKVLGDQVRDAQNNIHTTFSIIGAKFQSFDIAGCLQEVEKGSDQLIDLENNRRIADRLEANYIEKHRQQLCDFRTKCIEYEIKESFKSESSKALDSMNNAKTYLKSDHLGQAQEYFEQGEQFHFDNENNREFQKYSDLLQFEDYKKKYALSASEYKEQFFITVFEKKFKKKTESAQTLLQNARVYFESYKYAQALEYAQQAQEKASKIINNKTIGDRDVTKQFFAKFKINLQKFYDDYDKRMLEEKKNKPYQIN